MTDHMAVDDPVLVASVKLGEGCRLQAYADPDSPLGLQLQLPMKKRAPGWATMSGAPWTAGWGTTGDNIKNGTALTQAEADALLLIRLAQAVQVLDAREPWWRTMSLDRQRVLCEMTYNLGFGRLCGFHRMLADLQAGKWADAAKEMMASVWAGQVHDRARRLSDRMIAG